MISAKDAPKMVIMFFYIDTQIQKEEYKLFQGVVVKAKFLQLTWDFFVVSFSFLLPCYIILLFEIIHLASSASGTCYFFFIRNKF